VRGIPGITVKSRHQNDHLIWGYDMMDIFRRFSEIDLTICSQLDIRYLLVRKRD
jgi:hypothetical protein